MLKVQKYDPGMTWVDGFYSLTIREITFGETTIIGVL